MLSEGAFSPLSVHSPYVHEQKYTQDNLERELSIGSQELYNKNALI